MPAARPLLIVLALLSGAAAARAQTDDIPVVGRPVDLPFSEASGWFAVEARAGPTTLAAEAPLTFTLTVRAERPARHPPRRLDLSQLPAFADAFFLDDADDGDVARPDDRTWEFAYRLRPRRTDVTEIPGVPFVYFNPYLLTARKGFQTIYTDPIPLHVLPRESVQVPLRAPERVFTLATGPAVLERQAPWTAPRPGTVLLLLLSPPAACAAWYVVWRRMYPDAARQARLRRSRAARQALGRLDAARRLEGVRRAERAAHAVADYLRQRLDLPAAEPTPDEVAGLFARHGLSPGLAGQATRFFRDCDAVRFQPPPSPLTPLPPEGGEGEKRTPPAGGEGEKRTPPPPGGGRGQGEGADLVAAAVQLVLAVEEQTCPAERS